MAIQRWDPLRDLLQLRQSMNRLFDDAFARSGGSGPSEPLASAGWRPPVDVCEQVDRYLVRADLPGIETSDLEIELADDDLIVRGERRVDPSISRDSYLRMERPHGRFTLQLAIPPSADRQGIQASRSDGVLEIVIPKRPASAAGRVRVEVK